MAVNLLYKGDLAEVSLAKETGLFGQGTNVTSGTGTTAGWNTTNGSTANSSTITVGAGIYWVTAAQMEIPDGMLVGATLRIYSSGGSNNFTADDYPSTKRTYYISANSGNTITIQPRLATTAATGNTGDYFIINSLRVPTMDAAMGAADQRIKADQFLGLLNSFTLPEPEIDVKTQHVIGMGRDVNVMTSGKEILAGGAYDTMAHSLRMFKYALGGHTARSKGEFTNVTGTNTVLDDLPLNIKDSATAAYAAHEVGAAGIDISITATTGAAGLTGISNTYTGLDMFVGALSVADTGDELTLTNNANISHESAPAAGLFKVLSADGNDVLLGYYGAGGGASTTLTGCVDIDTGAVLRGLNANIPIYLLAQPAAAITAGDLRISIGATLAAKFSVGDYLQIFDKDTVQIPGADAELPTLNKHEIRRVIAIGTSDGGDAGYLYVEEAFLFNHTAASMGIERMKYTWDSTNSHAWKRGSPALVDTTNELKYGVIHNFFGYSYLPTFTIEQSFRQTDVTPGEEQLLRVFSGCKMNGLTCTADSEGEVKISGDYEAGRMFTDTGSKFITPHRMFENTANTRVNRRVSGIAVNGEKPYLFQHVAFSAFGASVLRALNAEMSIANGNTARWYIRGTDGAYAAADQVQESATQYSSEITEAAREYTFKFSALVEDSRWFDELRKRTHHTNTNDITLTLTKPGSAAARQNGVITIEDYTVMKAEHPLPDDKGPVTAQVEFKVRHMKVTETNPYFTL
tara:strand:+ start:2567 stop:4804 length:2238 start_codon:yes stop_codon:yes gene_type:complete